MSLLEKLDAILQLLVRSTHLLSSFVLFPAMVCVVTVDVVGRFLFNSPLAWSTEGSGLIQIMGIFLAAAYVESTESHIRLDILYDKFSVRGRALVGLLTCAVAGAWVYMLGSRSYTEIFVSHDMLESGMDVTIPYWPIRAVMTFAFFVLGLQLVMHFFQYCVRFVRGGEHV